MTCMPKVWPPAAEYFKDQDLDASQLLPLLQTMLGGGEASVTKGAGGLLDSLVGSIGGEDGLVLGDILSAGAAFMEAKESGDNNLEAAMDAVISASKMGESPHRAQSSNLVADVLLQTLMGGLKYIILISHKKIPLTAGFFVKYSGTASQLPRSLFTVWE